MTALVKVEYLSIQEPIIRLLNAKLKPPVANILQTLKKFINRICHNKNQLDHTENLNKFINNF